MHLPPLRPLVAFAITLLAALGGLTSQASANSMRCGQRHVDRGDTMYKVQSLCGDPVDRTQRTELRLVREAIRVRCGRNGEHICTRFVENQVSVTIDSWIYDLGPQRLIRYLTFENGVLVAISSGGYGRT